MSLELTPQTELPTAFVLMPFERQSDLLFERILCPALEKAGMHAVRADSVLDQQSVMRNVVEGIADATLVVAEISQVNAGKAERAMSDTRRKARTSPGPSVDQTATSAAGPSTFSSSARSVGVGLTL